MIIIKQLQARLQAELSYENKKHRQANPENEDLYQAYCLKLIYISAYADKSFYLPRNLCWGQLQH